MRIVNTQGADLVRQLGDRLDGGRPLEKGRQGKGTLAASFAQLLSDKVEATNGVMQAADQAVGDLIVGRSGDIHGTLLAMERADLEFRLLTAVRNKVMDAYREIMRMNV